jgi:hypothetical protein
MSFLAMNRLHLLILAAVTVCPAVPANAQVEIQLRVRQQPGWDVRAREGRCNIRVWVDNRAEVRMRGDAIYVRTLQGSKGRDEGSECSQPLPYNSVRDFQIRQTEGRSRVTLAEEPSRTNNFTAMILVNDNQGGGDNYAFEVTWRAENGVTVAPAPFFDDVRACQDAVRQRFLSQNGRGSYIDFDGFADRKGSPGRSQGKGGQESIQGRGNARRPNETRDLTYSCVIDLRRNQVVSGVYSYSGNAVRGKDRWNDSRQLR